MVGTDILGLKFTRTAQAARVRTSSGDQIVEEILPWVSHARQYHIIDELVEEFRAEVRKNTRASWPSR